MAFRYNEDFDDVEFISVDMLYDGLCTAEETQDTAMIASIGLLAISLEADVTACSDEEALAFQEVWETASRMLTSGQIEAEAV